MLFLRLDRAMSKIQSLLKDLNSKFDLPWTPQYRQDGCRITDLGSTGHWAVAATLTCALCIFLMENYLDRRQQKAFHQTKFPTEVEVTVGKIDAECKENTRNDPDLLLPRLRTNFMQSQRYGMDKIKFDMISSFYKTLATFAIILLGVLPFAWDTAEAIGEKGFFSYKIQSEIGISLIFLFLVASLGMITFLPFQMVRIS